MHSFNIHIYTIPDTIKVVLNLLSTKCSIREFQKLNFPFIILIFISIASEFEILYISNEGEMKNSHIFSRCSLSREKSAAGKNLHLFVETSAYFMYIIFHQHSQKKLKLHFLFCWSEPFSLIIFHFSFFTFFTLTAQHNTQKNLFLFLLMISICWIFYFYFFFLDL